MKAECLACRQGWADYRYIPADVEELHGALAAAYGEVLAGFAAIGVVTPDGRFLCHECRLSPQGRTTVEIVGRR